MGATFAYFTASTQTSGSAEATVTTTKLQGATITFNSAESKFELLKYPGGLAVYGAKATIAKQEMSDPNDYEATFNLKIDYTNETDTDLTWDLYMVESEYAKLDEEETTTCKLHQKGEGNETQFWYADIDDSEENTESCDAAAITTKITSELTGKKIASGKLKKNTQSGQGHITKDTLQDVDGEQTDGDLNNRKINTSSPSTKYYYIVIKYPNSGEDQSPTDAGKTISATLSIDGDVSSTLYKG